VNTADILDRAATLIEERGWNQHYYVNDAGGLDLDGALYAATGMDPKPHVGMSAWPGYTQARDQASHRAYAWLSRWMPGPRTPISWNDMAERTKEEVISTLRAAARAARAEQ
jgi:hypothetical protein